jgi:hypothetical protein
MTGGLLIWAAQFTIVYGVTAVACARGYGDRDLVGMPVVPLAIALATIVGLVSVGFIVLGAWRRQRRLRADAVSIDRFLASSTFLIGVVSLIAIAWTGLPALVLPGCG